MNLTEAAEITVQREQQILQEVRKSAQQRNRQTLRAPEEEAQGGIPDALAYIRSYHKIRAAVGFAGWALPFFLVIGWWLVERKWNTQTSLSAYYHTGMGDFFVTILVVVGVLLVAYKLSDTTPDNSLGTWAGALAFGVAFFPTARNPERHPDADLSAIQSLVTETGAQVIHFTCAFFFIILLARICIFFSKEEMKKEQKGYATDDQKVSSAKWARVHRLMAQAIAAAIVFVAVFLALTWMHKHTFFTLGNGNSVVEFLKEYCVLLGEAVAVVAFGTSWFIKGLDREFLRAGNTNAVERQANLERDVPAESARPPVQ